MLEGTVAQLKRKQISIQNGSIQALGDRTIKLEITLHKELPLLSDAPSLTKGMPLKAREAKALPEAATEAIAIFTPAPMAPFSSQKKVEEQAKAEEKPTTAGNNAPLLERMSRSPESFGASVKPIQLPVMMPVYKRKRRQSSNDATAVKVSFEDKDTSTNNKELLASTEDALNKQAATKRKINTATAMKVSFEDKGTSTHDQALLTASAAAHTEKLDSSEGNEKLLTRKNATIKTALKKQTATIKAALNKKSAIKRNTATAMKVSFEDKDTSMHDEALLTASAAAHTEKLDSSKGNEKLLTRKNATIKSSGSALQKTKSILHRTTSRLQANKALVLTALASGISLLSSIVLLALSATRSTKDVEEAVEAENDIETTATSEVEDAALDAYLVVQPSDTAIQEKADALKSEAKANWETNPDRLELGEFQLFQFVENEIQIQGIQPVCDEYFQLKAEAALYREQNPDLSETIAPPTEEAITNMYQAIQKGEELPQAKLGSNTNLEELRASLLEGAKADEHGKIHNHDVDNRLQAYAKVSCEVNSWRQAQEIASLPDREVIGSAEQSKPGTHTETAIHKETSTSINSLYLISGLLALGAGAIAPSIFYLKQRKKATPTK